MQIRHTEMKDIEAVSEIYAHARRFMTEHGNPRQWALSGWPPLEVIQQDITDQCSYVCVDSSDEILAVFCYRYGIDIDPCYRSIDGAWIDASAYGVVHRIAVKENGRGVGSFCIEWAYQQYGHLRMDTHPDNTVMQHLLNHLGFQRTGIIHVQEDNDPRIAYEKCSQENNCRK